MIKRWPNITYSILFVVLTVAAYATFTFVDYSFQYPMMIRVVLMGICYLYFHKLTGHLYVLLKANRPTKFNKGGWSFMAVWLCILHLILVSITTDTLNRYLIQTDNKQTIATIKDCRISRGTEYCVYAYTVGGKHYETSYCNGPANLKFKESDTAIVIYYSKLPKISKLKKEFEVVN